jgi:DNA polymerase bacteriophage-type
VLELRQAGAHAAAKKLTRIIQGRSEDGRVRGALRYHGAATGRWSSLGVQVHNLKRPETKNLAAAIEAVSNAEPQPLSVVGDVSRAVICAAPGHRLIAADFSGVESRLTAWISGQQSKLDAWTTFDRTKDPKDEPYYVVGLQMGVAEDQARTIGKTADLAFGYMGGISAWRALAPSDTSSDDEIKLKQRQWRELHSDTFKCWYALDRSAKAAIASPGTEVCVNERLSFCFANKFLWMQLPSGRRLAYPNAFLKKTDREDVVVFHDNSAGGWRECRGGAGAYGGTWIENAVQAVARDVFAAAMLRLDTASYQIVLHVHDEIVAEVPDGFGGTQEFERLITELPDWAAGLPIAAKTREGLRFCKT